MRKGIECYGKSEKRTAAASLRNAEGANASIRKAQRIGIPVKPRMFPVTVTERRRRRWRPPRDSDLPERESTSTGPRCNPAGVEPSRLPARRDTGTPPPPHYRSLVRHPHHRDEELRPTRRQSDGERIRPQPGGSPRRIGR